MTTVCFLLLALVVGTRYLRRNVDRALFLAALVSCLWAVSLITQSLFGQPDFLIRYLLELLRDATWLLLLFAILKDSFKSSGISVRARQLQVASGGALGVPLCGPGSPRRCFRDPGGRAVHICAPHAPGRIPP